MEILDRTQTLARRLQPEPSLTEKRLREMLDEESKTSFARNVRGLAKVSGLAPADGMGIEFRSDLNDKIIEVVAKKGLTHSDVARLAHTHHAHA